MPLSVPIDPDSVAEARPVLFGLLADGSGEARFAFGAAPFGRCPDAARGARFSPSPDWYGRWSVRPLPGILAARAETAVRPEDIVAAGRIRRRGAGGAERAFQADRKL